MLWPYSYQVDGKDKEEGSRGFLHLSQLKEPQDKSTNPFAAGQRLIC